MKNVPLSNSRLTAIVSDSDYEKVMKYSWHLRKGRYTNYAFAHVKGETNMGMHRYILGLVKGELADHKNRNGLDNRRTNLRYCTISQNLANRRLPKRNSSGLKGVYYRPLLNKWYAAIYHGKSICLGFFKTKEEAAIAYNKKAKELFGEFAFQNIVEGSIE